MDMRAIALKIQFNRQSYKKMHLYPTPVRIFVFFNTKREAARGSLSGELDGFVDAYVSNSLFLISHRTIAMSYWLALEVLHQLCRRRLWAAPDGRG